jgi:hypothetical protein
VSELGPESRRLFKGAREDYEPSEDDRTRTSRALGRRLGIASGVLVSTATSAAASLAPDVAAAGSAAGGATAAGSMFLGVTKWLVVGVLVSAVGAGGGVVAYRGASRAPLAAATSHPTSNAPAPATAAEPTLGASVDVAREPAPVPLIAVPAPAPALPSTVKSGSETRSASAPAAVAVSPEAVSTSTPSSAAAVSPLPVSPVADETRLLRSANQALHAGDAARALTLLEEHARLYPHGILTEERSAERVSALCALGRIDDAKLEAARFLASTPDSPLAASVRTSCGGDIDRKTH